MNSEDGTVVSGAFAVSNSQDRSLAKILEDAMSKAILKAFADGYGADDQYVRDRIEEARLAALESYRG